MTICIAAISAPGGPIVTVSDTMLSDVYDRVAARDNATMKNFRLLTKWGIMFSGNSELFYPVANLIANICLGKENEDNGGKLLDVDVSIEEVENACVSAYRTTLNRSVTNEYLSKLGFSSTEDFLDRGFIKLGGDVFSQYVQKIEAFDLGIEFIVYGYDSDKIPHIITVENPGVVRNHRMARFAVIGSGLYVARAALHRKDLGVELPSVVYRLLDAKFCAEFASGVGRATSVITLRNNGTYGLMEAPEVSAVRDTWEKVMNSPEPEEAVNIVKSSKVYWAVTADGTKPAA